MNDHELDIALGAIGRRRTDVAVPPALRERVAMVPSATPRRHGWLPRIARWPRPLFSTAKFVLAAAIVALFGGLVLLGILAGPEADRSAPATTTPSPSPVTVDEMLAGMTVNEEIPGDIVVENDGYRDVHHVPGMWGDGEVAVGRDGSVWIIWPAGRFFRLGDETMYDLDAFYDREHGYHDIEAFEVGPDGTLWATSRGGVVAFDPVLDEWTSLETGVDAVHALAIGADGAIWVTSDAALVRIDADGSTQHPWPPANTGGIDKTSMDISDDGVVWLMWDKDRDGGAIVRFDQGEWHVDPLPSPVQFYVEADVSPDGILWVAGDDEIVHRSLARFDGTEWTVFGEADGVQPWGGKQGFVPQESLRAAPDGSVLVDASSRSDFPAGCAGTGRFDGTEWTEMASPWCAEDMDIGPDGSLWALAPVGPFASDLSLMVIRPEATITE
jgi:hypothetical protein